MTKIRMLIELDVEPMAFDPADKEGRTWFEDEVLKNINPDRGLVLHSNEIGESVGTVEVLWIYQ